MYEAERDESLEQLEERLERRWAREDEDEEVALRELIETLSSREGGSGAPATEERSRGEFICTLCNLVRPRSCLADEDRMICVDCAAERRHPSDRTAPHRWTIEAPCPACGTVVMVPEREDAACGFFCPECGAHVLRRGGRLHIVWNHRYHPDLLPRHRAARSDA